MQSPVLEVRFVVNNEWPANNYYDDTGFKVIVRASELGQFGVTLSDARRAPIEDFEAEIQWLDASTFEVHPVIPDHDVEVVEMRAEVLVEVRDKDGVSAYWSRDIADWTAERAEAAEG